MVYRSYEGISPRFLDGRARRTHGCRGRTASSPPPCLLLCQINGSFGIRPLFASSERRPLHCELHRMHGCGGLTGSVFLNDSYRYLRLGIRSRSLRDATITWPHSTRSLLWLLYLILRVRLDMSRISSIRAVKHSIGDSERRVPVNNGHMLLPHGTEFPCGRIWLSKHPWT